MPDSEGIYNNFQRNADYGMFLSDSIVTMKKKDSLNIKGDFYIYDPRCYVGFLTSRYSIHAFLLNISDMRNKCTA